MIVESTELAIDLAAGQQVTIDPAGSQLALGLSRPKRLNRDRDRIEQFRARHVHEIPPGGRFGSHESVIEPGAVVTVAGTLVRDPQRPDQEIMFRGEPETRARIIGDSQRWIRIVDALT